jgi:hypothetical protein
MFLEAYYCAPFPSRFPQNCNILVPHGPTPQILDKLVRIRVHVS